MANPFQRDGRWHFAFKDRTGKRRYDRMPHDVTTKGEARRLNTEMQAMEDRIRSGIEKAPAVDEDATFAELVEWYLEKRLKGMASYDKVCSALRKHVVNSKELGALPPGEVTPGKVTDFLSGKADELAPGTRNNLRAMMRTVFNAGAAAGRFHGKNPITREGVKVKRVPKRKAQYLEPEWICEILDSLPDHYRGMFAVGIYAGLRKGEILALRKSDVDLQRRQLIPRRSHGSDQTKSGHEEGIPIAAELMPYLQHAVVSARGELLFCRADGSQYPERVNLSRILRTALKRCGFGVTGYTLKCRRSGCGYSEASTDGIARPCPKCNFKLWPSTVVEPFCFHGTRHTTASLLLMFGAQPGAVQKIMRHRDIRMTTEVYGHMAPEYLQAEANLLSFRPKAAEPAAEPIAAVAAAEAAQVTTPVLPTPICGDFGSGALTRKGPKNSAVTTERDTGLEPVAFSLGKGRPDVADGISGLQPVATIDNCPTRYFNDSQQLTPFPSHSTAPVLRTPRVTVYDGGRAEEALLSCREVAARLGVCTATVYKLCERGELTHVRVLNAVRVTPSDLAAFIAGKRRRS